VNTRPRLTRLRRRYGAGPFHLAGHLIALAVVAFAIDRIAARTSIAVVIALYIGLAIGHDLVLLPAYSGLDRLTRTLLTRVPARKRRRVPAINHLRAPALISGLLLVIYAPLISGRADRGYLVDSGHPATGYLRNWLLISAALFLGSGLIYALRVRRAAARS
jgi:Na+/melibiose symporter-like transporter